MSDASGERTGSHRPSAETLPTAYRYMNGLFALAHDPSSEVRKIVCTGLVQMLHLQPQRLQPHMHDIIEYMLASTQASPPAPHDIQLSLLSDGR